jgi:transcriptional regulator with XRE-family HTH domain
MIGLEYMIKLNDITQQEIADKLGIKQQNIDLWIRKTRNIPLKYISKLAEMFVEAPEIFNGQIEKFLQKDLDNIDKIKIQKIKLFNDCRKLDLLDENIKIFNPEPSGENFIKILNYARFNMNFRTKNSKNNKVEFETKGIVNSIRIDDEVITVSLQENSKFMIEVSFNKNLKNDFIENVKINDKIEVWGNILMSDNYSLKVSGFSCL